MFEPLKERTYLKHFMRTSYPVCYHVCDDKRLRKVFKTMRGYGPRYHIAVHFRDLVTGPVLAGIGRHYGVGLFASPRKGETA